VNKRGTATSTQALREGGELGEKEPERKLRV
jgi:hypothetical protein